MTEIEQKKFYELLGKHIRVARNKAGLKQEAFASYLGLSRASVVNIEKGRQHPPIHLLWVIARALHIDVTELLPMMESHEKITPEWEKMITEQKRGDEKIDEDKVRKFLQHSSILNKE